MNNNEHDLTMAMNQYLEHLTLSDDDPGLLVSWNFKGLAEFANQTNTTNGLPIPKVTITNIGAVTEDTIMKDIVAYVRKAAGTRFFRPFEKSDVLFAPNDLIEYSQVLSQLVEFLRDPWVAAVIINCQPSPKLGSLSIVKDKTVANAKPFNLSKDSPTCPFSIYYT